MSYRRTNEPRPLEVAGSTAGASPAGDLGGSIARFHIQGIADERHHHNGLEQKIASLEVLLAELRAEWDEFIAAQLEMEP